MLSKINREDLQILDEIWHKIKRATVKIIRDRLRDSDATDISPMLPAEFQKNLILGNGKWGIVLGIPAIPELVIKLTTDPFEWFLVEMLRQDKALEYHPALPFTLGTAVLDVRLDDMPLYVIVRENLIIGVPLEKNNPLTKSKKTLISEFIEPMEAVEEEIAKALSKRKHLSLLDISTAYNILSGETRRLAARVLTVLPHLTEDSEFFWVLDLQKKLLERGIALVDIHPNNLGRREFEVPQYVEGKPAAGRGCIVVSDLGMAYGTPIFLDKGMLYRDFDEMIEHFVKIYRTYSSLRYIPHNGSGLTRANPAAEAKDYVSYLHEEIRMVCKNANEAGVNVLTDPDVELLVSVISGKIMKILPRMHLSAAMMEFSLRSGITDIISGWIEEDLTMTVAASGIQLVGYVDEIDKGLVKCSIANEVYSDDARPIGYFEVPEGDPAYPVLKQTIEQVLPRNKRLDIDTEIVQYIPVKYLKKMNGVSYESLCRTRA